MKLPAGASGLPCWSYREPVHRNHTYLVVTLPPSPPTTVHLTWPATICRPDSSLPLFLPQEPGLLGLHLGTEGWVVSMYSSSIVVTSQTENRWAGLHLGRGKAVLSRPGLEIMLTTLSLWILSHPPFLSVDFPKLSPSEGLPFLVSVRGQWFESGPPNLASHLHLLGKIQMQYGDPSQRPWLCVSELSLRSQV